jgi:hypothetical protein
MAMALRHCWGALLLILLPRLCAATEVVGYLAEFSDVVECPRPDVLRQTEKPRDLHVGDTVVTRDVADRRGTARAFLADRQTIALAGDSELLIGGLDAPAGMRSTAVRLNRGRVRVYVSEGADCRIETPAGVVTCRHTDFVVAVDARTQAMDVLVIDGVVEVTGRGPAAGPPVTVLPYQMLHVAVGAAPGLPQAAGDAVRARYTTGLQLIGYGTSERLPWGLELAHGSRVLVVDRPSGRRPNPWGRDFPQEQPGTIANPLFGVPGSLQVDY